MSKNKIREKANYVSLKPRCPRCDRTCLFNGLFSIRKNCPVCGLDISEYDDGDYPIFFTIVTVLILDMMFTVVIGLIFGFQLYMYIILWLIISTIDSIALIRVVKAAIITMRYDFKQEEEETI
ncbi:MAG: DUF983 domain-containing protein [Rickettsiales bacterium]